MQKKMAPERDIGVKNKYPCTSLFFSNPRHIINLLPSFFLIAKTVWGHFFLHLPKGIVFFGEIDVTGTDKIAAHQTGQEVMHQFSCLGNFPFPFSKLFGGVDQLAL